MLNGEFKEAIEGSTYLPEENSDEFDVLIEWAYTNRLRDLSVEDDDREKWTKWDPVEVYSMAEKMYLPELMDIIMDKLIAHQSICRKRLLREHLMGHYYNVTLTTESNTPSRLIRRRKMSLIGRSLPYKNSARRLIPSLVIPLDSCNHFRTRMR
jgi:hypothetical protein